VHDARQEALLLRLPLLRRFPGFSRVSGVFKGFRSSAARGVAGEGEAASEKEGKERRRKAAAGARAIVALSVSISARTSPAAIASPTFFFHDAMLPAVMVGDSEGIPISV